MASGRIGEYHWAEFQNEYPELAVPRVVRGLASHVRGLRAVNVSWDSGRLLPSDSEVDATWVFQDGYAVSPVITDDLIAKWPYSGEGFDEWYFFRELPTELRLEPYCNWCGASVADWQDYTFQMDLVAQLDRMKPVVVIGESRRIFVIAREDAVVADFLRLAREV